MNEKSFIQKFSFDKWIVQNILVFCLVFFFFFLSTSEDLIYLMQSWSYNTGISDYSKLGVTLIFLSNSS